MIRRRVSKLLRARRSAFPAAALLGARQVGKTTLARSLRGIYFDLEQPEERLRLDLTWDDVTSGTKLVILDEAQSDPKVFPRLRGAIDRDRRRNGRILLLGSVSPWLIRETAESLAGRLAVCELTPLSLSEIGARRANRLWLYGGYPDGGILEPARFPVWQINYLETLAQRDLPAWGLPADPRTTMRLFRMLAAAQGGIWNASDLGRSLGLSYHTVNTYLGYMENAYLIRVLPCYHKSLRRRLVKSPRIFWRDSGLLHAMLGVRNYDDLLVQPWVGASWEGWVIEQIISHLSSAGIDHQAAFFRTHDGQEVDLVLELNRDLWAIEIKLSSSPSPGDFSRLDGAADLIGASKRCIVSRTRDIAATTDRFSTNLPGFLKLLDTVTSSAARTRRSHKAGTARQSRRR